MSRMLPRSVACLCRRIVPRKCIPVIPCNETREASPEGALGGIFSRVLASQFHSSARCGGPQSSAVNCDDPDFDPTEARSPPSEKIVRLVDEIASLTLLEVSDLTTLLKKRLGLPNIPVLPFMGGGGMMPGAAAAPVAQEKKEPEKTAFDVKLEKFDAAAKIKIIKEVRTFTSLGLKEAKELVEKVPALLKKGVSKEEATQIIEKIKAVGGIAVME